MHVEPFSIRVEEKILADLRARLRTTRWPVASPGEAWQRGTDLGYLRQAVAHWADGFDWRAQERELNAHSQFLATVDGLRVHFVHERAVRAITIIDGRLFTVTDGRGPRRSAERGWRP